MRVNKKNLLFSSLPSTRDLKKMMKADMGATAGPGNPGDIRLKNMLKTLPDNYFDVFGKPDAANPQNVQRADTKGGFNPIQPPPGQQPMDPNAYNPGVQPQPVRRQPNIGNAMLLGLEAVDAAIPGDKAYRHHVTRPQMGYSQYPQGTGSQAIMADGGTQGPRGGKKPPIYTNDPKDQRIKKYQDSLAYSNWSKDQLSRLKNKGYNPKLLNKKDAEEAGAQTSIATGEQPTGWYNYNQYTGEINNKDFLAHFPEPEQPYIYKNYSPNRSEVQSPKSLTGSYNPIHGSPMKAGASAGKNKTNFSFTGRDDRGQQDTRYFSDLDTWKAATDMMGYSNRETTDNDQEAHATGYQFKDGGWIKGAVNPAHKGYCTPMTKKTCTPRRKAFAKTMKKHHGFHEFGGIIPDNMSAFTQYDQGGTARGGSDTMNIFEQIALHPNMADMEGWAADGRMIPAGPDISGRIFNVLENRYPINLADATRVKKNIPKPKKSKVGSTLRGGSDTTNIFEQIAMHPNISDMQGWDGMDNGGSMRGGSDTMNIFEQIALHPNMSDMKGWDKAKSGKTLSKKKAREILHDGTAQGHPITEKQRRYFGAVASGYAASGIGIGPETGNPPLGPGRLNPNTDPGRHNAYLVDEVNYRLTHPTARAITQQYNPEETQLLQDAFIWGRRADQQGKSPQDVISSYFNKPTQQDPLGGLRQKLNQIGYGAAAMYNSTPDLTIQDKNNRPEPTLHFKDGGMMFADGGEIETMWGGDVQQTSNNPYDGGTMEFNGASHNDGGIGMHYNGNPVEVEGGETASRDSQGNLNIYGNMYLPGTRTKFKHVAKEMGKKEKRYDFLKNRGAELVNNSNPANRFDKLSFNAGRAMMEGGSVGQKDLAEKKENLAMLQRAMLDTADEFGIDAQHMSKGRVKRAKMGAYIPVATDGADLGPGDPNNPTRADRNKNPGNIRYSKFAREHGAIGQDKDGFAIFSDVNSGKTAMQSLLKSDKYKNLSVKEAIHKWTGNKPYKYDLGEVDNKKVSDLTTEEFDRTIGTMTKGEGTRYGGDKPKKPAKPSQPPTATPKIPGLPDIPLTPDGKPKKPGKVTPPPLTPINYSPRQPLPTNAEGLGVGDVAPELYAAASNKTEPVPAQFYHPELFTPYQVSFQDRINQNQSSYNALQRTIGATNPTALGAIAGQKYAADSGVKAEEFRTNQAISNDITNKNIALSNDAQLKNLGIADTQMVRQSTARSKTREYNQMILNSLSSKYAQNQLEQKRLKLYENLYDYRFMPTDQNGLQATYMGPDAVFNSGRNPATASNNANIKTVSKYDRNGNLTGYTNYDESSLKDAREAIELEMQRRKLPLLNVPPL